MTPQDDKKVRLFVVSAPSGAGKSTLTNRLLSRIENVKLSISCTTRPRRGDEVDGREYYFLKQEEFFSRRKAGDFLEWAQVHGNYYGTSRSHVEEMLDEGNNVIFDIDVQGAANLKKIYPDAVLIFISPPSRQALELRLRERKTDDPVEIEKRLSNAGGELVEGKGYDFIIINDDLEQATDELVAIVKGRPHSHNADVSILDGLLQEFSRENNAD